MVETQVSRARGPGKFTELDYLRIGFDCFPIRKLLVDIPGFQVRSDRRKVWLKPRFPRVEVETYLSSILVHTVKSAWVLGELVTTRTFYFWFFLNFLLLGWLSWKIIDTTS